ncbi:MAG: transglutaminase domain-containing protein [bacterium]|nr:transglutaminase domain-containing protein [bacterium]
MRIFVIILFIVFSSITHVTPIHAQSFVTKLDGDLAAEMKKKYPKSDVIGTTHETIFTFALNRHAEGTAMVSVFEDDKYEVLSLKSAVEFSNSITYDFESSIRSISGFYKNGGKAIVNPIDMSFSEFYTTDTRYKIYKNYFTYAGERFGYKTSRTFHDVKYFTSVYFPDYFPQQEKRIVFDVPNWLELELKEMNFDGFDIQKTIEEGKKSTRIIYTIKNIFGAYKQANSPGPSHILPHVLVIAKSVTSEKQTITLLKTTDDLYKWYRSLVLQVKNNPEPIKAKVNEIILGKTKDEDKIKAIYYWVQDNIIYLAYEAGIAGFKPAAAQDVFKRRYGDCKGMANLCKEMLKIAGFDARLTWVGTRLIAYDYSIPSLSVDNHMICTVILNGKRFFIDGTEKYGSYHMNAYRIQGRPVMIEDGENYFIDKVPAYCADSNLHEIKRNARIEGENLVGHNLLTFKNDYKTGILVEYNNLKSEHKDDAVGHFLSKGKNEMINNVKVQGLENRDEPLIFENDYTLKHSVISSGKEIYLTLDYARDFFSFTFDSTRLFDYEFQNSELKTQEVKLTIPQGYTVKYTPANFARNGEDYSFKLTYSLQGNELVYKTELKIPNGTIHKKNFADWNKTIKDLNKFYKEQIILIQQ